MKRKVFSAIMAAMLGILPCFASSSIVIHLTDGTGIICSLAKEPQMLFGEKTITLTSLTGTVGEWDFTNVESWEFSDALDPDEMDAIDKIKADKPQIKIEEEKITVSGNKAKNVAVYDINGRMMFKVKGSAFNVNRLTKGTYLLKTGNSCIKFSVR